MPSLDRHVTNWMRSHQATVSRAFLEESGVTAHQRRRLVEHGVLERVVHGGYRFAGIDADELTKCAALCASRPRLVVAGPTAGRLWKIRRSPNDRLVHVIAPPASQPCRQPWVRVYRTALLHDDEIVERPDGIRLTSPPRTLIDLTRYLANDALASAIESALSSNMCTVATLWRVAERLNTPGRPWVRRFSACSLGARRAGLASPTGNGGFSTPSSLVASTTSRARSPTRSRDFARCVSMLRSRRSAGCSRSMFTPSIAPSKDNVAITSEIAGAAESDGRSTASARTSWSAISTQRSTTSSCRSPGVASRSPRCRPPGCGHRDERHAHRRRRTLIASANTPMKLRGGRGRGRTARGVRRLLLACVCGPRPASP